MSNIKQKRSIINYSNKRQMQLRLLVKVMIIALIATGLTSTVFYLYSNQEVGQSFKQFHINARNFLDFLFPAIIIALVIGVIIAFGMAIFFPHKIAGPLYRIERDIKEKIGEGDFTVKFTVRKGDEVADLADALNTMMAKLRLKIDRIKNTAENLLLHADTMNKDDESVRRVSEIARRLEEAVKEFKL